MAWRGRRDTEVYRGVRYRGERRFLDILKRWESLRQFRGEQEAANFLDHLKHLRGRHKDRVLELLRLVQKAEGLASRAGGKRNRAARELEKLIMTEGALDQALATCRIRPAINSYLPSGELEITFTGTQGKPAPIEAIWELVQLAGMGLARRLRQCSHCNKWFFAHFDHQTHCPGGDCRIADFRKSEKWKAYRRKKSREYYWLRLKKNVK